MGLTRKQLEIVEGHYTEIKELGIILDNKVQAANNYYSNILTKHYVENKNKIEEKTQEVEKEAIVPKSKFNQGGLASVDGKEPNSFRSKRKSSTSN